MNRRDSIQKLVLGGTVLLFVPSVLKSCTKNSTTAPSGEDTPVAATKIDLDLTLPDNSALNTTDGSLIVQSILVVNTGTGFIALSSICTHQGCTVAYTPSTGTIQCGCHGSQFATTGSVINGPATLPLQSHPVTKAGNVLTISL